MESPVAPLTAGSPFELPNGTVLGNRLVKASLSEQLGSRDNGPTPRHDELYRRWGQGGFGLILTGNVMIDRRAVAEAGNVVVEDDRDFAALQSWAAAAKAGGSAAWVQINHPGRQSPRYLSLRPVAPSAVRVKMLGGFAQPRALREDEIEDIIERWATAAEIVVRAGFDGVQVHSAHGYLGSQFLSPITNQRTDAWGGDPERRMRFLLEVVRAVRKRIGPSAGLGVKLNSADFQRGGFTEAESMDVVEALSSEGLDLLEISGGTYEQTAFMGFADTQRASTREREAYFLSYAEAVRARATMPLLLTGGLRSIAAIDAAISSGAVDLVGLGRPACVDTAVARNLLDGATATALDAPTFDVPGRSLSSVVEAGWYTAQMWRVADGHDPRPSRHPLLTAAEYGAGMFIGAARRGLARPPRYAAGNA